MFPSREMPRDTKKRSHPDELHLNTSLPKRLLCISEAELGSVTGSPHDPAIPPTLHSSHGSIWSSSSSSSALITSDCSISMRPQPGHNHSCMSHSGISVDAASSKLEGPGFTHSRISSNTASYHLGALKATAAPPLEGKGKGKGVWAYHSNSSRREGIELEAELSEVTFEKHTHTLSSSHRPDGVSSSDKPEGASGFGKTMHVISRRDASSLNSNLGMDELWHKGVYGYGDQVKQLESISTLYGARQRRGNTYAAACETGSSCATGDSSMEDVRSSHEFSDLSGSFCKEAFMESPNNETRAGVMVGASVQERSECADENIIQCHPGLEVVSQATGGHGPSYVLSSGRLSLEEEAKLGRRAPTIDRDFEEYFSSLML